MQSFLQRTPLSLAGHGAASAIYRSPDPFPPSIEAELHYADLYQMTTGTGGVGGTQQTMRLTSLFDPDLTNVGHQPYGYDQLQALYGRYKVMACEVTVMYTTPGAANDILCSNVLQGDQGNITLTAATQSFLLEQPAIRNEHLSSSGNRYARSVFRPPLHEVAGLQKAAFENDIEDYAALCTASPARNIYFTTNIASYSNVSGETCAMVIQIVYRARFWERVGQSQS